MKIMAFLLAVIYLRLSEDERKSGESSSISNQRLIIQKYCEHHNIIIIKEFIDDGYSGSNFFRPGFQSMLDFLETGQANVVISKDLSRLGRDMREASFYAEQYFPEKGLRYIAPNDNFDTLHENPMAPFQFAMNEMYLRDGSKKVRDVLKVKREEGQYCACPPYGYRKAERESKLIADEQTSPVVELIFEKAASGDSSRKIAEHLNEQGIIPPLKYRVLFRDDFGKAGAARAADYWNATTVKRILRNQVYLGHTILGKTRKVSVKSKKKVSVSPEDWAITKDTHSPLVSQSIFDLAQRNLANNTRSYREHTHVRKSIFGKVAFCAKCGYAMCSAGTVYKGEREKYWYLACNNIREKGELHCDGVRIKYYDLVELVRDDLNQLISCSHEELLELAQKAIDEASDVRNGKTNEERLNDARSRILAIDKIVGKLYTDNAEGKLSDDRLERMISELERESVGLQKQISQYSADVPDEKTRIKKNFDAFYELAQQYTHIETLDRETLLAFIDRIEIGPKNLPDGIKLANQHVSYQQEVAIHYRFIGAIGSGDEPRMIERAVGC